VSARVPPSHDDIARRAIEIAKRRGGRAIDVDDWQQAERELRRERGLTA
jgi:hypothetical protein